MGRRAKLGWATVFLFLLHCGAATPQQEPPWEREKQEWEDRLHQLESRLLWSQARVRDWQALAERHRHVSEIACRSQGEHFQQMARSQERQRLKPARAASVGRGVVAPAKSR